VLPLELTCTIHGGGGGGTSSSSGGSSSLGAGAV